MKPLFYLLLCIAVFGMACSGAGNPGTGSSTPQPDTPPDPVSQEDPSPAEPASKPKAADYRDVDQDPVNTAKLKLTPHTIGLAKGDTFDLMMPEHYAIYPAAQGLKRIRFMAVSPDKRIFLTDMYNLADNKKGKVYILDGFDRETKQFDTVITWLSNLRNPNSVGFYKDVNGVDWIYVAQTQKLSRYRYTAGETSPTGEEQVLATFPDYGLSYKYGGWHLTRTVAFHNHKVYVSVGSSCNVCEEKEEIRASIVEMDPDGSKQLVYASGLRNAVDIQWVGGQLFGTNMAADHLGNDVPADGLYLIEEGQHYGWPYCYETGGKMHDDHKEEWQHKTIDCSEIPTAYAAFEAHASPLGLAYFHNFQDDAVNNYFLAALHGSSRVKLKKGYHIVRTKKGHGPEPVITGFLQNEHRVGRPCGILPYDDHSFFFTDDHAGVLYFVETKPSI